MDKDELNMALSRLGVEYAANLATGFAMQQSFRLPATSLIGGCEASGPMQQKLLLSAVS